MIKDEAKWEFDAVKNLIPTGILVIQKHDLSFEYRNVPNGFVAPTKEELDAEVNRLKADYDAKQYQRDRVYPSIGEQLDLQYWDKKNGTKKWEEAIDKVKADHPKG